MCRRRLRCRLFGGVVLACILAAPGSGNGQEAGVSPRRPDRGAKQKWAVLVGIDDYTELGKLRFAGNDQRALSEQLIASGFPKDQVFLLHDKSTENKYRPFRQNVQRQLELVLGLAGPGDLVIVGFSGHGVQVEGKSYLCPLDAELDQIPGCLVPLDDVYQRLARCKATLKLLLVDACRNDLLPQGRRSIKLSRSLGEFAGIEERPPEGILLLASCGPGQVSMEDEAFGHGVFMHYLLEGLQGKAAGNEGSVSLASLYDYASIQTKKYVARKFNQHQTPGLKGEVQGPFEICSSQPGGPAPAGTTMPSSGPTTITNSLGMKLVLVPAGEFMMGNEEGRAETLNYFPDALPERIDTELPRHRVRITKAFYLGQYTVTLNQFLVFYHDAKYQLEIERDGRPGSGYLGKGRGGFGPSAGFRPWAPGWEIGMDHPVVFVSWNDAVAFCDWLSKREGKTCRLPTEAEWEYACRAGTSSRYYFGNDPEELVRYANAADQDHASLFRGIDVLTTSTTDERGNLTRTNQSPGRVSFLRQRDGYAFTAPVGRFRPNPFGLYDMHGNVWQWCSDRFDARYYDNAPADDPTGPATGELRVLRGGCYGHLAWTARCAFRGRYASSWRQSDTGFRVVCEP